jgi:4'-phosphopantetheinyl transferase
MPLLLEISPDNGIRAGVWKIKESAEELLGSIHLSNAESTLFASFHHELRKRQWLACRVLLKHLLFPLNTTLSYDRNGKPFLKGRSHYISLSHSGEFAAAVYSEKVPVGIDIERVKERVERVKERFLGANELESVQHENRLEQLYVFWCGKEALYKLYGEPDLDFRNDIHIHPIDYLCNTDQKCKATIRMNGSMKDYTIHYQVIEDCMLVVAY